MGDVKRNVNLYIRTFTIYLNCSENVQIVVSIDRLCFSDLPTLKLSKLRSRNRARSRFTPRGSGLKTLPVFSPTKSFLLRPIRGISDHDRSGRIDIGATRATRANRVRALDSDISRE